MTVEIAVTQDIEACHALRRAVFIAEQGVTEREEIDGLDDQAIHLLAHLNGKPVGTARILVDGAIGKIGRVCVLKDARGTGMGRKLIEACLAELRAIEGIKKAKLGAQISAIGFYETIGFTAFGPLYDDAGIPHRDMERAL
jgi:ElaA protein